jgi:hypothetical protein
MKHKLIAAAGTLAIGMLGFAASTQAAPIYGSQSKVENGCIIPIPFFVGQDCSYDGSNPGGFYFDIPQAYIGPMAGESYYLPGESAGVIDTGAAKRLGISGDLVVDGAGTISGTIDIAAGERISACTQADVCTESWDSISHTVPSTAATSAAVNTAGGMTYEYSSLGMPVPLEPCVGYFHPSGNGLCDWAIGRDGFNFASQLFPSVTPSIPYAGGAWKTNQANFANPACIGGQHGCGPITDTAGVTTQEGGFAAIQRNDGIQTTATMVNYNCVPGIIDGDCNANVNFGGANPKPPGPPGGNWTEGSPDYENLHMKVSTNASGTIIACEAVWVQEYSLIGPPIPTSMQPDSWGGGTLNCSGIRAGTVSAPDGYKKVQVNKKNLVPVVIYGAVGFDVSTIDDDSLRFGAGDYSIAPTTGAIAHHITHGEDVDGDGFEDLVAHFHSNESGLVCGQNLVALTGTSDGVPFVVDIGIEGHGKACR